MGEASSFPRPPSFVVTQQVRMVDNIQEIEGFVDVWYGPFYGGNGGYNHHVLC